MHPLVSRLVERVVQNQHLLLPTGFFTFALLTTVNTPLSHSLLITSVSWALIWTLTLFRVGFWAGNTFSAAKSVSWAAGILLALAKICERAARDRHAIWWTQAALPFLVFTVREAGFWSRRDVFPLHPSYDDPLRDGAGKGVYIKAHHLLSTVALSAGTALATKFDTPANFALGLASVVFTAAGLVLFEGALRAPKDDDDGGRRRHVSGNGSISRRASIRQAQKVDYVASLRDVAAAIACTCGLASAIMEPMRMDTVTMSRKFGGLVGDWQLIRYPGMIHVCILTMLLQAVQNVCLFVLLSQKAAVHTSLLALAVCLHARLIFAPSFFGAWFTTLFMCTAVLFFFNSWSSSMDMRHSMRVKRLVFFATALSIVVLALRTLSHRIGFRYDAPEETHFLEFIPPDTPLAPAEIDMGNGHPIDLLIKSAEKELQDTLDRQSASLQEAVDEYRRRYGIPPPPNFDRWYEFATRAGVQLVDEYDGIMHSLLPFWGLKPATIRARVREALGFRENALIGVMVRDGNVVHVEGGAEWQQQATAGMVKEFVQHLPDMDLAFNIHDEPRVVVPHDMLSMLLTRAREESIPAARDNLFPRNSFSARPPDLGDGTRFEEAKTSRFNRFAHQQTWTHSSLSCPPDSAARVHEDRPADNFTAYAFGPLGFVYNETAFSDICNSPSFSKTFGFFERPNAFNLVHDLIPIFSQSKISSFQDILYPSPWYWFGRVGYNPERDMPWEEKTNSLYWRGSTTGGFSRNGGWRRQHRQHLVARLNAPDTAQVLFNAGSDTSPDYQVKDVRRKDYAELVDVHFSHIGQCDPEDCHAQEEFFDVTERADGQDAWGFKHLLDMDGNAFSGRFYAFLKSHSLTYKMAVFREWHQDWLRPWVHYVPLSLRGDDWLELVSWFAGVADHGDGIKESDNGDSVGELRARQIAQRSTEWVAKVLRNEDFEVWFFRLLLEFGRLVDDDRDVIGYPGP